MNKLMFEKAKGIIILGRIQKDGENYWKVDGEILRKITSQGKTELSCTCKNCTSNIGHPTICHRKIAVIIFEGQNNKFKKLIREHLEYLDDCKKINQAPDINVMVCLLRDLQTFVV